MIKLKKKITSKKEKKMMWTCVNFSNLWHGSLDQKHLIYKNYKAQFSTNQILKDEIIKEK